MKCLSVAIILIVIFIATAFAGGGGGQPPQVGYLSTTTNTAVSFSVQENPCLPSKMPFDFEPVNGDATFDLDLVWGKTYYSTLMLYSGNQRFNNGNGDFPNDDGVFFSTTGLCAADASINDVLFGKLRPWNNRRDLAMLRQNEIRIYQNTGNGMATSASQILSQGALSGSWAPFVAGDDYEDLVVYDGSQVRAYRNLNDGTLYPTPVSFSISATKVFLAQMDESIHPVIQTTRFDLVSYSGSQVTVRLNNNNNGFSSTQTFDVGLNVTGFAIGDINNDGFNDIVVGGYGSVKAYLNNNGSISTSPSWSISNLTFSAIPLIGDMGTPTDPNKNDGWNDIVITGYGVPVLVFANNQGSFNGQPEQSFYPGGQGIGKAMLADIQNTGGLSLVYEHILSPIGSASTRSIRSHKHTGNPAPAPPKGVGISSVQDQYGYRYPKLTWAKNNERDLNGYVVYRRLTGFCGYGPFYPIATLGASVTEYVDWSIGTVGYGDDCTAYYYLAAKDVANNTSDSSRNVFTTFGSAQWKVNGGDLPIAEMRPVAFALHSAYPNPFNPSTTIKYELPEQAHVSLALYDVLGREVAVLVNQVEGAGFKSVNFDASKLSSGVYLARFAATDGSGNVKLAKVMKLVLAK